MKLCFLGEMKREKEAQGLMRGLHRQQDEALLQSRRAQVGQTVAINLGRGNNGDAAKRPQRRLVRGRFWATCAVRQTRPSTSSSRWGSQPGYLLSLCSSAQHPAFAFRMFADELKSLRRLGVRHVRLFF